MKEKQLQLASFEQAKRLKKLGFDWKTSYKYARYSYAHSDRSGFCLMRWGECCVEDENNSPAPTVALAFKWMRDVKEIVGGVSCRAMPIRYYFGIYKTKTMLWKHGERLFDTYEAAESALLDEILHILENIK